MGASNSTRTVTIDNDSPGIIDVSDEVVKRLKGGIAKANASATRELEHEQITNSYINPSSHPIFYGETLTAADVLRKKEAELQSNDLYWSKKIEELEKNYQKSNVILEEEYNKTIEEVKKLFEQSIPVHRLADYTQNKSNLIKCFEENSKEPLKCSRMVNDFIQYVGKNTI